MTYAPEIILRPWTVGGTTTTEAGEPLFTRAKVTASRSLMLWGATGWRYESATRTITSTEGAQVSGDLPVCDQSGWRTEGNAIIDVSVPNSYTHTYTIKVTQFRKDASGREIPVGEERTYANVFIPTGDLSPFDLDMMLPVATVAGGVVLVPDSLSARVDALEAGAGGGAYPVQRHTLTANWTVNTAGWPTDIPVTLILTQDGTGGHTVTHDAEALDVDNTPGGETVTAWVWTGTAWRWFSDAAPAEVVVDETPPTAGNLQLGVAPTTITATTQGAMDETALHPQPFRFAIATAATSNAWTDAQWRAAMGAWQASATTSFTGLTMGTAYNVRCEVRDMAGNARLTAVASGTTTVIVEPTTYYEANFTAADGTLLSAYTPDVGGPGTFSGGNGKIYGNALWSVPDPEWHSQPTVFLPATAALKLIRWTFDYDLNPGGNYAGVHVSCGDYATMGVVRLPAGPAVAVGGDIAHGGILVSNEVSPTAPTVPMAGRATVEFEGTPGVNSNWVHRIYIDVAGEPVLHTTVVVTRTMTGTAHRYTTPNSTYQGTPGVIGTKLDRIHMEGVPA